MIPIEEITEEKQTLQSVTFEPERPFMIALFHDKTSAEKAYHVMYNRGYRNTEISILMSEEMRSRFFTHEGHRIVIKRTIMADEGTRAEIGRRVDRNPGIADVVKNKHLLPKLNLVVTGPLFAGTTRINPEKYNGGLKGVLTNFGIPEEVVERYDEGIKKDQILIAVHPHNQSDANYFEEEWRSNNTTDLFQKGIEKLTQ